MTFALTFNIFLFSQLFYSCEALPSHVCSAYLKNLFGKDAVGKDAVGKDALGKDALGKDAVLT